MSAATNISVVETLPPSSAAHAETIEFGQRMSRISRHSLVYFAGMLFSAAAGYFFKIYLARALGAEALGVYALGMSIVAAVSIFNAVGLPTAGTRFVAEYSSRREYVRLGAFLRAGISLLGAGNLILGAILLVVAPWISMHFYHTHALAAYSWSFALIMLLGVLNTFLAHCMAGFQAIAQRTAISNFVGTGTTIVAAVVLISLHFGLAGYLVAQVASATVVLILMAYALWQRMPPQARSAPGLGHFEKKVVAFSATAFGISAVHFILGQADKVALGYYLNARQVGIYAVSMALVGFVPIALQSVNQIFAPTIAELHAARNYVLLQRLYASLTKWVLIITIPLALTVAVFSKALMTVFGSEFEAGAGVLAVGTIAQLFDCGVGSVGFLLLMSGNQLTLMKIQAANATLMVVLNILLVPRLGILGAALASAITVAGTNLWGLVEVRQKLKLFPYDRTCLKLIWPTIATMVVLVAQRHTFAGMSWREAGIALICAYAAFFGGMLLLGFGSEDRMLASLALQKLRNIN